MPQKTNLNISPYYDDFNKDDNFYKVLFKPGFPVQARELTGLQSLLQNQVESFGKHIFKEGSMVIPGNIELDRSYFSAKVNDTHLGIDVSIYLNNILANNGGKGTRVRGRTSGIVATIKNFILPPAEGVDNITIFIKYVQSGTDGESVAFPDGEVLILEEPVTYGNTTITIGETILTLVSEDATATGCAFGVNEGVYFMRGSFVDVPTSLIILEPYNAEPSYRVGFDISEEIINSNDDPTLYDNAKGFTNFAAPGADRFKISVKLAKKALNDYEDTNFVELMRVDGGELKKLQNTASYSEIKAYFAKRTFDESGNYAVEAFRASVQESLNDEIGNKGLFTEDRTTDQGNTPSDDLMCVKLSPGKAYVKGFDVNLSGTTVLDVEKPRETQKVNTASVPFEMGSLLRVNNVQGTPLIKLGGETTGANGNVIKLQNSRKGASNTAAGLEIGQARIYSYSATDAPYTGATTQFDLYLYDIQTYTILKLGYNYTLPAGTRIRGLSSGSVGFMAKASDATGANEIALLQTTGAFITGEQLIVNEKDADKLSVKEVLQYTVDDIKSVFQDADTLDTDLPSNFSADSVLYDRVLPGFSPADQINIVGTAATTSNRSFAGATGIKTDSIIAYNGGGNDLSFNKVTGVSVDGKTLTLASTTTVAGINVGSTAPTSSTTTSAYRIKVPRVLNLDRAGLFSELPKRNVSEVDTANSNLIITQQIKNQNITSSAISFSSQSGINATAGITSVFFEPFDVEKYSIHYTDGTTEPLTSDQVLITNGGANISFVGLSKSSGTATVNVTLKKLGVTSKTKDYLRSQQVEITRTSKINTINNGLTVDGAYGMRIEDEEISLNVPDVNKVIAVFESKNTATPLLDKLTFVAGLSLNTNAVIGEQLIGQSSRAVGQVVNRGLNTIDFVYLNDSKFTIGEIIKFKESGIETILQGVEVGNYIDKTDNYVLDKGHRQQYSDYSRIVRKSRSGIPSKRLLVIFDHYKVASGNTGDLFTVNSYTQERFTKDIPLIPLSNSLTDVRATDLLDNRPRVVPFVYGGSGNSPFAFTSREFESTNPFVITPNESSLLGFSHYLGRIDKVVINKNEEVQIYKGVSSEFPVPPSVVSDTMEIAEIEYPAYVYDTDLDPLVRLKDNRRFTMRDIANLEKRIINLETITALSALELDTKAFQVRDADGLDRFKTGFVVNDFKDRAFINFDGEGGSSCDVDVANKQLISAVDFWSMNPELALNASIDVATADTNSNLQLLDPNCQKTGDLITLKYQEVDWIESPHATTAVNVNPFNVLVFSANIKLDPPSDNWSRTIYVDNHRTESTGARWAERSNIVSRREVGRSTRDIANISMGGEMGSGTHHIAFTRTTVSNRVERSFTNVLEGPSREFTYVESTKVNSEADPFMRSRNVYFATSNLKPFTRHYHFLDSGIPDIVPKLFEIEMSSGTFLVFEDVRVELNGVQIGLIRSQSPNHKFGDESRPEVGAGLGSPNRPVETYEVDPYDRTRPAPSSSYSATSKLFNVDCIGLANLEKYFGYVVVGAKLTGVASGAVATVSNINLFSDNWGDLLGAFFFRDPNATPQPPVVFRSGTLTFRITSSKDNEIVPFSGDAPLQSSGSADFLGTGVVISQNNQSVSTRNPARPPQRPNAFSIEQTSEFGIRQSFEAPDDDPLAQSFTVDGTGAFLTSFDVYFKSKDPIAKLQVQLRTVELGVPTSFLVQDYAAITLNPSEINVSDDASVPTTIRFTSPIYLEGGEMYSLVFLCPSSDKYEMWVATMGEKSIKTTNLPDVQNVVVSKQYLGGSLYKSQNGTIWTPSQNQDLTFKLRKAAFVPSGSTTFYNTPIEPGNFNCQTLITNPIRSLPRKLKVSITGSGTRTNSNLPIGRKVSTGAAADLEDQSVTGVIEGQGSGITGENIILGGTGYAFSSTTAVPTVALTGSGTGATVNLSESGGVVSSVTINAAGSGYQVGDVLTVDNNSNKVTRGANLKFVVTAINSTFDTLYLTDVQGEKFTNGETLVQYTNTNANRTVVTNVTVNGDSVQNGDLFGGNVFEVTQFNHAHHGALSKVDIQNVKPDTTIVPSTSALTAESTTVSLANTAPFASFSGIATDRGEALIEEEIVSYVLGTGELTLTRGVLNTTALPHPEGASVQTYEACGVSLAGINTIFTTPTNQTLISEGGIDNYYLEVDRTAIDPLNQRVGNSLLCFTDEKTIGGNQVKISQNHQYSSFSPQINFITPGTTTTVNTSMRTISGTSAGGSEISYLDQGFNATTLNETTFFLTPRLVASTINQDKLTFFPKQKSVQLNVDMTTGDENLSPILDTKNATFIFGRNKINNPIGRDNYATDNRPNQLTNDPHGSTFITDRVDLENPATSLKVIVGASVEPEADIRAYYRLFSADSSEVSSTYRPFPGFNNMIDENGDGFGDTVIDPANSDGRPDKFVAPNRFNEFSEYQFTADDLEQFNGFSIKIVMTSTNESVPVKLQDFRAIALA